MLTDLALTEKTPRSRYPVTVEFPDPLPGIGDISDLVLRHARRGRRKRSDLFKARVLRYSGYNYILLLIYFLFFSLFICMYKNNPYIRYFKGIFSRFLDKRVDSPNRPVTVSTDPDAPLTHNGFLGCQDLPLWTR